jgi:hypothetical protein
MREAWQDQRQLGKMAHAQRNTACSPELQNR